MGLVAVALAVSGVLRPAGGPLVSSQSHRPVGEHRDALGNTPVGLGRKQCELQTLGHFQRSFLTLLKPWEMATGRVEEELGGRQSSLLGLLHI